MKLQDAHINNPELIDHLVEAFPDDGRQYFDIEKIKKYRLEHPKCSMCDIELSKEEIAAGQEICFVCFESHEGKDHE